MKSFETKIHMQCNFEPLFMHNFENEYYLESYLRLKKTRQGLQLTCQEGWCELQGNLLFPNHLTAYNAQSVAYPHLNQAASIFLGNIFHKHFEANICNLSFINY